MSYLACIVIGFVLGAVVISAIHMSATTDLDYEIIRLRYLLEQEQSEKEDEEAALSLEVAPNV